MFRINNDKCKKTGDAVSDWPNKCFWIIGDNDLNGKYDEIGVYADENYLIYNDMQEIGDETFATKSISVGECMIDGITIDLTGMGSKRTDVEGNNYCVRYLSTGQVVLTWAGRAASAGLAIAACFQGNPTYLLLFLGAGTGFLTEVGRDRAITWPS